MEVRAQREAKPDNNSMEIYIVIAIALVIIVIGTYLYNSNDKSTRPSLPEPLPIIAEPNTPPLSTNTKQQTPPESSSLEPSASEQAMTTPVNTEQPSLPEVTVIEPQEISEPPKPLPSLDKSDAVALTAAQQLSWLPSYAGLLSHKDIIRNFVVFIDNLSRGDLVTKFSPLPRPSEKFSVTETAQEMYFNEASYSRYNLYVDIINSIDIEFATNQYLKFRPLFDTAYQELGYPDSTFEATMYQAIDVLLSAPIIREPIKLVAPSAMYKFADPALEELPAAHKLMIRMGPDNQIKLKPKLLQIQLTLEHIAQQLE